MLIFAIIIILISVILGLFVLIQNPKGGGLAGTFGGVGNQLMGVKQTTDVLEKGTWILAGAVALLCLLSPAFIPKDARASSKGSRVMEEAPANLPSKTNPGTTTPMPGAAAPDTNK
jgi:preprotein translocase subunit SecG